MKKKKVSKAIVFHNSSKQALNILGTSLHFSFLDITQQELESGENFLKCWESINKVHFE